MEFLKRFGTAVISACEFHFLRFGRLWIFAGLTVLFVGFGLFFTLRAPSSFVPDTVVVVPKGASAGGVATLLDEAHVIAHPELFRNLLRLTGGSTHLQAGAYRFASRENLLRVLWRVSTGDYAIDPVRVTLFEGMTARSMGARIAKVVPEISESDFISAAQPYEGYLFPDTYFIPPSADAASVVAHMRQNFDEKTAELLAGAPASGRSISDLITMAALVEREANNSSDRHMVAGVLWNRIARGMPLQVDAVFGYIFSRETYSPSFDDLGVDSPYNTYTHKGLPPGPIANPGLDAIHAALYPTKSNYLYYLTGKDGITRYATTYEGQLANQRRYLR